MDAYAKPKQFYGRGLSKITNVRHTENKTIKRLGQLLELDCSSIAPCGGCCPQATTVCSGRRRALCQLVV